MNCLWNLFFLLNILNILFLMTFSLLFGYDVVFQFFTNLRCFLFNFRNLNHISICELYYFKFNWPFLQISLEFAWSIINIIGIFSFSHVHIRIVVLNVVILILISGLFLNKRIVMFVCEFVEFELQPSLFIKKLIHNFMIKRSIRTILDQSLFFSIKYYHEYVLTAKNAQLYCFFYEASLPLTVCDILPIGVCNLNQIVNFSLYPSP